jgi:hypothetical protein
MHKPGKVNTQADPLSCMSLHSVLDAADNMSQVMLKPEQFANLAASHVFVSPIHTELFDLFWSKTLI